MKIAIKRENKTVQVWPEAPFLAYDCENPALVFLVLNIDEYPIFLGGVLNVKYPYKGNETFAEKAKYRKHALFTGTVELKND